MNSAKPGNYLNTINWHDKIYLIRRGLQHRFLKRQSLTTTVLFRTSLPPTAHSTKLQYMKAACLVNKLEFNLFQAWTICLILLFQGHFTSQNLSKSGLSMTQLMKYQQIATVFIRLNAAAFITFLAFPLLCLFKGGIYLEITILKSLTTVFLLPL